MRDRRWQTIRSSESERFRQEARNVPCGAGRERRNTEPVSRFGQRRRRTLERAALVLLSWKNFPTPQSG